MTNKREVVLKPFLLSMQNPIIKMYVFLKLATQHCSRNAIQWETRKPLIRTTSRLLVIIY